MILLLASASATTAADCSLSSFPMRGDKKASSKPHVKLSHPSVRARLSSTRTSLTIQQVQNHRPRHSTTSSRYLLPTTHNEAPPCEHVDDLLPPLDDNGEQMIPEQGVVEHQVLPDKKPPVCISILLEYGTHLTQNTASALSRLAQAQTGLC